LIGSLYNDIELWRLGFAQMIPNSYR